MRRKTKNNWGVKTQDKKKGRCDTRQNKLGDKMRDKKIGEARRETKKNGVTRRETKKNGEMRCKT